MPFDVTAWPTLADLKALLQTEANITLPDGSDDLLQLRLDAAVQELGQRTKRQFLPSAEPETRFYDGSGTGRQEIDEYIDITSVKFYWIPAMAVLEAINFVELERNLYPKTMLQIYRGMPNATWGYITRFPEGRSNVEVTGTFGYAATIPTDVWEAVLQYAAAKVADALATAARDGSQAMGRLLAWDDGNVAERYAGEAPSVVTGWRQSFADVCKRYSGRSIRKSVRPTPLI